MKKLSPIGALALAALVAGLALLGFSGPAQAYPDVRIDLSVNRSVLYGGQSFTATAKSDGITCAWRLEWNGDVRHGASSGGHDFVTSYHAPQVKRVTKIPLHGTCTYASSGTRGATAWERTIMITVLPPSTAVSPPVGGSDLPNTGGPNLLYLLGGIGLLLAGATAVTVARRRAEDAEFQASGA
jgi:LPXTG-motif cell wall-anchored protein